ncbi:MAG: helix-turn-helix transcriptional regulator [Clostridia bacterium]|nr:helix-turn-helix transcriptional regulator [Clostridia bacterium]
MENTPCKLHKDAVEQIKQAMPPEDVTTRLGDFYKIFGDSTRIKILYVLLQSQMCVCDISAVLDMNQSAISHQLKILKHSKLVKCRREGKSMIYSLADSHVESIVNQGMKHICE